MEVQSNEELICKLIDLVKNSNNSCTAMIMKFNEALKKRISSIEENQIKIMNSDTSNIKKRIDEFDIEFKSKGLN